MIAFVAGLFLFVFIVYILIVFLNKSVPASKQQQGGVPFVTSLTLFTRDERREPLYKFDFDDKIIVHVPTNRKVADDKAHVRYNNDYSFTVFNGQGQEIFVSEKFSFYNTQNTNPSTIFNQPLEVTTENTMKIIKAMTHFPILQHKQTLEVYTESSTGKTPIYIFDFVENSITDARNQALLPFDSMGSRVQYTGNNRFEIYDMDNKKVYESDSFSFFNDEGLNVSNVFSQPVSNVSDIVSAMESFPNASTILLGRQEFQTVSVPTPLEEQPIPPSANNVVPDDLNVHILPPNNNVPPAAVPAGPYQMRIPPLPTEQEQSAYVKADNALRALEREREAEIGSPENLDVIIQRMEKLAAKDDVTVNAKHASRLSKAFEKALKTAVTLNPSLGLLEQIDLGINHMKKMRSKMKPSEAKEVDSVLNGRMCAFFSESNPVGLADVSNMGFRSIAQTEWGKQHLAASK